MKITMDCERVQEKGVYPAGPESWGESIDNIFALADIVSDYNYRVIYYAVPEAAEAHVISFKDLKRDGHTIGLHLHSQTYRNGINANLGDLSYNTQYDLIANAYYDFKDALGFAPIHFRPGYFSHNIDTIRVINQFRMQGSWARSAIRVNRLVYVYHSLLFMAGLIWGGEFRESAIRLCHAFNAPPDLDFLVEGWPCSTLRKIVDSGGNLTLLTHNYVDYTDSGTAKRRLIKLLEYLK